MKNVKNIFMIALVFIIASCTKEGPQGPAGTDGTNGINGTNGTNGVDGNANVIYSEWISVADSDWTGMGTATLTKVITEAKVTTDIIDKGVVLVFHQYLGYTYLLPYMYSHQNLEIENILNVGSITIKAYNGNGFIISSMDTMKFRYVIIPATNHVRLQKPLTEMTYQEICNMYHIPM